MNKVILIGTIENSNEIKMSANNLEILELSIDEIKAKAFGKLAMKCKDLKGLVCADGNISVRDYTNKDGKTYPIQEVLITKIESLEKEEETPKEETKTETNINTKWESAKEIKIDPDELPFY